LGNGDGTFRPPIYFPGAQDPDFVALADVDGSGTLDVVTANSESNTISVLLNDGMWGAAPAPGGDPTLRPASSETAAPLSPQERVDQVAGDAIFTHDDIDGWVAATGKPNTAFLPVPHKVSHLTWQDMLNWVDLDLG